MRSILVHQIRDAVADMYQTANYVLSGEMRDALRAGAGRETRELARNTLLRILENADVAERDRLPICQDTGLVVVFAEIGQEVNISGGPLQEAIDEGVRAACRSGYLRPSVSNDPIQRNNSGDNTPAIVHVDLVPGHTLRLRLLAKGGGCENMSRFAMLTPADGADGVIDFITRTAIEAGPNACPPMVVGAGVGGSFESSALLSKKALLRPIGGANPLPHIAALERGILQRINASGVGPQGYGGATTSLAVHIETAACHIASLPVSVNIECHAHRHQEVVL